MNKIIEDQLHQHYPVQGELVPYKGGYQNEVYAMNTKAGECILRLSKKDTRSYDEIEGELAFCQQLSEHGVPLAKPMRSNNNRLIETITHHNEVLYAVAFEKAPGIKLSYPDYLNDETLFEQLGEVTGKLHTASKKLEPNSLTRPSWKENMYLKRFNTAIPAEKKAIHRSFYALINELDTMPKDDKTFGLIHGDINVGNFHYDQGNITLFDFDECQYSWYIEDIAIQLFYTIYVFGDAHKKDRYAKAKQFLNAFLKGYRRYQSLPNDWKQQLERFLRIREIILYVSIHRKWNFAELNAWQSDYLQDSTRRIEASEAVYEFKTK